MPITVTGATAETLSPTVEIKNGPCVSCVYWQNKECIINKTVVDFDCEYYRGDK